MFVESLDEAGTLTMGNPMPEVEGMQTISCKENQVDDTIQIFIFCAYSLPMSRTKWVRGLLSIDSYLSVFQLETPNAQGWEMWEWR